MRFAAGNAGFVGHKKVRILFLDGEVEVAWKNQRDIAVYADGMDIPKRLAPFYKHVSGRSVLSVPSAQPSRGGGSGRPAERRMRRTGMITAVVAEMGGR